jgi:hypothetical protein
LSHRNIELDQNPHVPCQTTRRIFILSKHDKVIRLQFQLPDGTSSATDIIAVCRMSPLPV